jgi:hypothetical protein
MKKWPTGNKFINMWSQSCDIHNGILLSDKNEETIDAVNKMDDS